MIFCSPGATSSARFPGRARERLPAGKRERVLPVQFEVVAGQMQLRERAAHRRAMRHVRPAHRYAFEESDHGRRPAGDLGERGAHPVFDRLRAIDPARSQVLHQSEEERQLRLRHPLLIERQDEISGAGVQEIVGVLHAFGDPLAGEQRAEIVAREELRQFLFADVGIDGHVPTPPRLRAIRAAAGKTHPRRRSRRSRP